MSTIGGWRSTAVLYEDGAVRRERGILRDENGAEREALLTVAIAAHELDEAERARFDRDLAAAGQLSADGVVTMIAFGKASDGARYAFYESVETATLREMIDAGDPLSPAHAFRVASDILDVLTAAHALDPPMIVGALRPETIAVDASGHGRLLDLGLSRMIMANATNRSQMFEKACRYYAPESAQGARARPASDVFVLASTIYEAITGEPAFSAATPLAVSLKIRMGKVPPLDAIDGLTVPMGALLADLWESTPEHRIDARSAATRIRALLGREADERRSLGERVAPVDREEEAALIARFQALDDDDFDPTRKETSIPNHIADEMTLVSGMVLDDGTERTSGPSGTDAVALHLPANTDDDWVDPTVRLNDGEQSAPVEPPPSALEPATVRAARPIAPEPPSVTFWIGVGAAALTIVVAVAAITLWLAT